MRYHVIGLALLLPLVTVACGDQKGDRDEGAAPAVVNVVSKKISYTHAGVELEGVLAYDANATEKRPGVLVIHEWWGLDKHPIERAARLAKLGYVTFCGDMYGKGKVTEKPAQAKEWATPFYKDPHGAGRERVLAALAVLASHEAVDPKRIGAMGFCYGGSVALELAWSGADVRGVVCFHGNLMEPPAEDEKGVQAAVLVCNGAADVWVPPDAVESFETALSAAEIEFTVENYAGAVHAFTNPGADARGIDNVAYDQAADEASWKAMLAFFGKHLGAIN